MPLESAYAFWRELPWAHNGLAAMITSLLLLAIRNEWDLITWIAPRSEPIPDFGGVTERSDADA